MISDVLGSAYVTLPEFSMYVENEGSLIPSWSGSRRKANQVAAADAVALRVNAMNLKNRLRRIETDECCRHRAISGMTGACPLQDIAVAQAGDVPLITLSPAR
jgi:hypothetical protein